MALTGHYRQLGGSGIAVSPLGLGTVKLGRNTGVKYPSAFDLPSDREASALLSLAADLDINLIDTAPAYGSSEERLGELLKGQRDKWIVCSKAGEEFDNDSGESSYIFTPEHLRHSVERSLKRLNTDYLDIVLVHSNGDDLGIIQQYGALDTLNTLKQEGKIRATGMSTKTVEGGILAAQQSDCVMVTWNLDYDHELPVIEHCQQNNKGVFIKKALASGHVATESVVDPVGKSFEMILGHQGVSSVIVGTINPEHLVANMEKAVAVLTSF